MNNIILFISIWLGVGFLLCTILAFVDYKNGADLKVRECWIVFVTMLSGGFVLFVAIYIFLYEKYGESLKERFKKIGDTVLIKGKTKE